MKQIILGHLLNMLKSKFNFKKIIIIASLVMLTFAGLFIWGVVATYNYVTQMKPVAVIQQNVQLAQNTVQQLPQVSLVGCFNKAQSLFNNLSWLQLPLAQTFENLKSACLASPAPPNWQDEGSSVIEKNQNESDKGVSK